MNRFSRVIVSGLLAAAAMLAADVTGKWTSETQGQGGRTMTSTFDLKAEGDKLTGTITGARGGAVEISDGKVNGNEVSFTVTRETQRGTMKLLYTGKVEGDELKLTMKMDGGPGEGREMVA
jgi:hypothetical protein